MHALAVTTVDVDESSSNNPVRPRTPGSESPEPESCSHPRRAQTLAELEDGQYTRSCRCGVVLDYWRDEQVMQVGLEQLASTWGVPVEAVHNELATNT
jgi:hypothetical protein